MKEAGNGGIEGIVMKTLLIAAILAVALKLGPHIGTHLQEVDEDSKLSNSAAL